jgi:3',5'-cyclic AMP phosphodiesterase CpdA
MKRQFYCFLTLVAALLAVGCVGTARPGAATSGTFEFAQLCDTQLGFSTYDEDVRAFRAVVAQVNARQPDFVIICGDLVNDCGNAKAIQEFLTVRAGFKMPVYCVPGNHDVGLPANTAA